MTEQEDPDKIYKSLFFNNNMDLEMSVKAAAVNLCAWLPFDWTIFGDGSFCRAGPDCKYKVPLTCGSVLCYKKTTTAISQTSDYTMC